MRSLHRGLSSLRRCQPPAAAVGAHAVLPSTVVAPGHSRQNHRACPLRHHLSVAPIGSGSIALPRSAVRPCLALPLPMPAACPEHMPQGDDVLGGDDALDLFGGAMPKEEIGALRFLKEYPEYDGRGIVIAILDTGVCPGAAGLAVTSDGKPKIVDIVDCTGSGDVDTSAVVKADADGYIIGASGSRLKVNSAWNNPSGEWHVGCAHAYRLFPEGLVSRIKRERRKQWDERQRAALTAASANLSTFERTNRGGPEAAKERTELEGRSAYLKEAAKQYEDHGPLIDCAVWHDGSCWRSALDTRELQEAATGSGKGGPEGGDGALASFVPMTDYKVERRYGMFSYLDSCTYVLNTYDNGNTLSIVVDCGAHGTHVAGITAAHFPEDPSMNGIAPGAQIVSCKIGDTRLGATETGTALTRALITVLEHKCQLINMSFGEPTSTPNRGRFVDLANELVHKHGVMFVASAGNNGPALSTVSAPGGTCSDIIGIGAFVSPALAEAGHSVHADCGARQYSWSSRGPTVDGHGGVAFSAPGGAIAPVPTWTLQKRQLMNGTSMAAPNASGGIALVLSGLKQLQAQQRKTLDDPAAADANVSAELQAMARAEASSLPVRVRRALDATCLPLGGDSPDAILTYGRGLIQVDAAFEYLRRTETVDAMAIRYDVSISPSGGAPPSLLSTRGIYLRQASESCRPASFAVSVSPILPDSAPNSARLAVEDRIVLEVTNCSSSSKNSGSSGVGGGPADAGGPVGGSGGLAGGDDAMVGVGASIKGDWVACPSSLLMHHSGRNFEVRVDGSGLDPGLHYAEVCGFDATARWRGPLFRVPITVIRPICLPPPPPPPAFAPPNLALGPLEFGPGTEHRLFLDVPAGATWAEVVFRAGPHDSPRVYVLRATQIQQQLSYKRSETGMQLTLSGRSEYVWTVPLVPGQTVELTVAQFWSCLGTSTLGVEVCFHGLLLEGAAGGANVNGGSEWTGVGVALDGSAGIKRMTVQAPLRIEKVRPEARLTAVQWGLRPFEAHIEALATPRDTLPEGRVLSRLVLGYRLSVAEGGWFTLRTPVVNQLVYDAVFDAQTMMIYDNNKKFIQASDVFPESCNLRKGDYTVRVMLRHESTELLEKMMALPVLVSRKMDSYITIPIYATQRDAITSSYALNSEFNVKAGLSVPLFLGPLPDERLPKDAMQGRTLIGTMTLGLGQKGGGSCPSTLPLTYVVPAPKQNLSSNNGNGGGGGGGSFVSEAEGVNVADKALQIALRDAKMRFLKETNLGCSGTEGEQYRTLYYALLKELKAAWPGHLPLLKQHLRKLDALDGNGNGGIAGLRGIVAAADEVIAAIDQKEIMYTLAIRCPEDTPEARKARSDMEEHKSALIDAMHCKCCALMEQLEREDREEANRQRQLQQEREQAKTAAQGSPVKAAKGPEVQAQVGTPQRLEARTQQHEEAEAALKAKAQGLVAVGAGQAGVRKAGFDLVVVVGQDQGGNGDGTMPVVDVPTEDEEEMLAGEGMAGRAASIRAAAPLEVEPSASVAAVVAVAAVPVAVLPVAPAPVVVTAVALSNGSGAASNGVSSSSGDTAKEFQKAFADLRRWVDTGASADYAIIHARAETRAKRYIAALHSLDRGLSDDHCRPWHRDMQALKNPLLLKLGWDHLERGERATQQVRYPKTYQPF